MHQSASTIMMVRPVSFQFNVETALSNSFQNKLEGVSVSEVTEKAISEFDTMVDELKSKKINVLVIEDTISPPKPDAIFPNNWISMSQDGILTLFPMKTTNRQLEKRKDIISKIENEFKVKTKIDLSHFENEDRALEGTGSIVYDHINRKAYACISPRTDKEIFINYCDQINYKPILFHAMDAEGSLIYHTNVVMCVGSGYVVIGIDSIQNEEEKALLLNEFASDHLEVIDLTQIQLLENFAGNMLQVKNDSNDLYLVMSQRAFKSLTENQIKQIEKYSNILPVSIDIIEKIGGGSARCMMAEIFLEKK